MAIVDHYWFDAEYSFDVIAVTKKYCNHCQKLIKGTRKVYACGMYSKTVELITFECEHSSKTYEFDLWEYLMCDERFDFSGDKK